MGGLDIIRDGLGKFSRALRLVLRNNPLKADKLLRVFRGPKDLAIHAERQHPLRLFGLTVLQIFRRRRQVLAALLDKLRRNMKPSLNRVECPVNEVEATVRHFGPELLPQPHLHFKVQVPLPFLFQFMRLPHLLQARPFHRHVKLILRPWNLGDAAIKL